MRYTSLLVFTALLNPTGIWAQHPTSVFDFRTIAKPGITISGYIFAPDTIVSAASLNDAGEAAFAVRSTYGFPEREAVFTSHRMVAKQGDVLGGKTIMRIPAGASIAINNSGQVAFEAWYADTKEVATAGAFSGLGIFVDDHLVARTALDSSEQPPVFTLTDDGQIHFKQESQPPAIAPPTPPKKSAGILERVRVKPPKDFPISISQSPNRPAPPARPNPREAVEAHVSAPVFPMNHRGQVLIAANLQDGFLLLLGTPSTR